VFYLYGTLFYTTAMAKRLLRTPSQRIGPAVLGAALEILSDEGPDGLTVRAIAKKAKVAPMTIYNHFNGKNGLLEIIWSDGFSTLQALLSIDSGDPSRDLFASALAYRAFALEHPAHYTVMFVHHFEGFVPSIAATQIARQTFQVLIDHIQRCQSVGLFDGYSATNAAQMIWAACHGYVSLEMTSVNFSSDFEANFRSLITGLLRGLGPSLPTPR
jgi:AcrR family transcriptional regulator